MSLTDIAAAHFPPPEWGFTAIGDLGCPGVDIDDFKRRCRAPLHAEGWNRWLLWRTTRDEPSAADVEKTAFAVLRKWFEIVEGPTGFSDPFGRGVGKVDNVRVRLVPTDYVSDDRIIARREQCDPLPLVAGPGAMGVLMDFVYRGTSRDMPWPVHKAQVINPWCPINADWILGRVLEPPNQAVPAEKSAREELAEGVERAASALLPSPVTLVVVAGVAIGVIVMGKLLRG